MHDQQDGLRPEEFGEAATAAIADALSGPENSMVTVLAQAGLLGVCALESDAGLGLDLPFAVPLAQAAGRLRLPFALAEHILLARHLSGTPMAARLAQGECQGTIAWQGDRQDGWVGHARQVQAADYLLVRDRDESILVDVSAAPQQRVSALDPTHPQVWRDVSHCPVLARLDAPTTSLLWHEGAVLMAATVHGAATGALDAAITHTGTRVQFDRPLSAKQAVRHWLSRMKLYLEVGDAAIRRAMNPDDWGMPRATGPALALNLQYAAFIIEKAIHLHGGMGFTWDVPLHHALREVRKIEAAWGTGSLAQSVGQQFIQHHQN